jgi:hypothetical protein
MNRPPIAKPRNLTFELTEAMREALSDGEGVLTEKIVAHHLHRAGLYICAATGQEPFCPRCGKKNDAGVSCSVGGCPIGGDT